MFLGSNSGKSGFGPTFSRPPRQPMMSEMNTVDTTAVSRKTRTNPPPWSENTDLRVSPVAESAMSTAQVVPEPVYVMRNAGGTLWGCCRRRPRP